MADESASWVSLSEMVWQHPAKIKMHSCFEGNLSATKYSTGTSLAVQWLRVCTSTAGGTGSIPGRGIRIPHAVWCSQQNKTHKFFFFNFGFVCLFVCLFIYLFISVLGLRFCARAFSSCRKWGPLFIAMCGPLTIAASAEHRLQTQTRRLSNCGSRA